MTCLGTERTILYLRRLGLLSIAVLLAQVLLGVAASLWVTIDTPRPWSHISNFALFAAHGVLGAAIVVLAFITLAKAFEESSRRDKVSAAIGFLGVIGAFSCGIGFVASGGAAGLSFGMAVGWVVALSSEICLVLPSSTLTRGVPPARG